MKVNPLPGRRVLKVKVNPLPSPPDWKMPFRNVISD